MPPPLPVLLLLDDELDEPVVELLEELVVEPLDELEVVLGHMPQSAGQFEQVSPGSQTPLPQTGGKQSGGSVGLPMQISQ